MRRKKDVTYYKHQDRIFLLSRKHLVIVLRPLIQEARGLMLIKHSESWEARRLMLIMHPKRNKSLLRSRRCFWVSLNVGL